MENKKEENEVFNGLISPLNEINNYVQQEYGNDKIPSIKNKQLTEFLKNLTFNNTISPLISFLTGKTMDIYEGKSDYENYLNNIEPVTENVIGKTSDYLKKLNEGLSNKFPTKAKQIPTTIAECFNNETNSAKSNLSKLYSTLGEQFNQILLGNGKSTEIGKYLDSFLKSAGLTYFTREKIAERTAKGESALGLLNIWMNRSQDETKNNSLKNTLLTIFTGKANDILTADKNNKKLDEIENIKKEARLKAEVEQEVRKKHEQLLKMAK
ncbi:MAG: hypothetical protein IJ837_02960 [Clostridia bacterium]|nr:hypothetical protein [Clostridia bacterium]